MVTTRGFAWQLILAVVLILAALIALSIPYVAHDKAEEQVRQTKRILAEIALAKAAYANENGIAEGRTVTIEQLVGKTKPVFPFWNEDKQQPEGELVLMPVGQLPVYKLKDGTVISPLLKPGTETYSTE
ncbi:hypothetical protein LLG95_12020 [bacterium]|nr:hypothetical protein [bacterium]